MPPLLLYIHGFNSSSLSIKAQVMKEYCHLHRPDVRVEIPDLPPHPKAAADALVKLIEPLQGHYRIGVVGSSLGGYLATWLHDCYGFPAVLVNPAVRPYELLQDYLGEQTNPYTQTRYVLKPHHMDELKALEVLDILEPERLWLLQQEGDEVLDYRQAVEKYTDSKQTVEPNGDHSFIGFERFNADIIEFLWL